MGEILHRRFVRALLASAAVACAIALAGCDTDSVSLPAKAVRPLSPDMIAEIDAQEYAEESPILVRIFKEEAELEVWKQDADGPLRAPEDLSDLSVVGRARPQG